MKSNQHICGKLHLFTDPLQSLYGHCCPPPGQALAVWLLVSCLKADGCCHIVFLANGSCQGQSPVSQSSQEDTQWRDTLSTSEGRPQPSILGQKNISIVTQKRQCPTFCQPRRLNPVSQEPLIYHDVLIFYMLGLASFSHVLWEKPLLIPCPVGYSTNQQAAQRLGFHA